MFSFSERVEGDVIVMLGVTYLSQHPRKALAILPSVFMQIFSVVLSVLFRVTLNTKQELRINVTENLENLTNQQIFSCVLKLTIIRLCRMQVAFQGLGNQICRL